MILLFARWGTMDLKKIAAQKNQHMFGSYGIISAKERLAKVLNVL